MSRNIVAAMQESVNGAYGLLTKFIEVCPDNIWNEVSGGWPVWQQVYHTASGYNIFADLPGEAPAAMPFPQEIAGLAKVADQPCDKAIVVDFLTRAKARTDAYINALTDEKLLEKNTPLSGFMGKDVPHVNVLVILASHTNYHLGTCDAALRNHGLKGVF